MKYSYDRTKVAAKMDLYGEWQDIVNQHDRAMNQDFQRLLKKLVNYMLSVGYDLDIHKSQLDVERDGSGMPRMVGQLHITERPGNTVKQEHSRGVEKWVEAATGLSGTARKVGDGAWLIDISEH